MIRLRLKSIRANLLFLVLLILIPLITIIFYQAHVQKQWGLGFAAWYADNTARTFADQQKFIETNIHQLLEVLGQLPEMKNPDTSRINKDLTAILKKNPAYASMILVDNKGDLIASGLPFAKLNVSDRKYFIDVMRTKSFAVGEYTHSRLTRKAVIHYAYPVFNNDSSINSILIVGYDLNYYNNIFKNSNNADDFVIVFVDHRGTILCHSPNLKDDIGTTVPREVFDIIFGRDKGIFNFVEKDGMPRLYGFKQLSLNEKLPYLVVYVGIPEKIAYAGYHKMLVTNIAIWVLVAIFIILSTYFVSRKFFLRPIDKLVNTTNRISEGNLEIRIGNNHFPTELGKLAIAIDEMAEKLLQREIERKKVEKDLKKLKERFELAINSANIGIWDWHIRNNFLIWDKNMFELYGTGPGSFKSNIESWKEFIHPDDLLVFEAELKNAIEYHQPFRSEFRIVNAGFGTKYIRIFASVINDKENKPVRLIGVNWDITERKKLEFNLHEAKDNAEAKNRLKSAFLANISHEIRTPLHGIIGFAQILKDSEITYQERSQYLDIIVGSGNKLLNIIANIIDISMLDAGQLKTIDQEYNLHSLLLEVFDYYEKVRTKENKGIDLLLDTDIDEDFVMTVDGYRFNQIFFNLIDNAFKFTEKGEVRIGCHVCNDALVCYVKDTGIGISPEGDLLQIFDHFKRLEEGIKGNTAGLGLAICKGLVELMGGRIWVVSKDTGAEFYFSLPLANVEKNQKSVSYGNNLFA